MEAISLDCFRIPTASRGHLLLPSVVCCPYCRPVQCARRRRLPRPPLPLVALNITPTSPLTLGGQVTLTASATGGDVPEYKFYALYPLAGVNQLVPICDYTTSTTCVWTPTLAEKYTLVVCAREHGESVNDDAYNAIFGYQVIAETSVTTVTLNISPLSPLPLGGQVTLTASATGGSEPEYEFYALYSVAGVNQLVPIRNYSGSSTCVWTPTLAANYTIVVCAREQGETVNDDAYDASYGYQVIAESTITAVTLNISPLSPLPLGGQVTLTASATGGSVPEYKFYALYPVAGVNQLVPIGDYSTGNTCVWTPTLAANYTLVVCAREQGETVNDDAYAASYGYQVIAQPIAAVTLNISPAAPLMLGEPVTLTATATGGSVPEYKFYALFLVDGVNQLVPISDYSTSNTCVWAPTLAANYTLVVCAREQGETVNDDAYDAIFGYQVTVSITSVALALTPSSPLALGEPVTLTATAIGGNVPEYEIYALYSVAGENQLVPICDYTTSTTCVWTPTMAGKYTLVVCAREQGETVNYDAYYAISGFQVTTQPVITDFTPSSGSAGSEVTVTGFNFSGATAVTIGGVAAAAFTVTNSSTISATVSGNPRGAITITTPSGTTSSIDPFNDSATPSGGQPVFSTGEGGYTYFRIPSLVCTSRGTLLAFCEGRYSPADSGNIDIVEKISTDAGHTWSPLQLVYRKGAGCTDDIGNPCAMVDTDTGTIWLAFCRNNEQVYMTSSADEGQTWLSPVEITAAVTMPNWTLYATGPGIGTHVDFGPYQGRLIIPCYHTATNGQTSSHVFYSDDHGTTWKLGGSVLGGCECSVALLNDGRLLLNARVMSKADEPVHYGAYSADGGATWTPLFPLADLQDPGCEGCMLRDTDMVPGTLLFSNPDNSIVRDMLTVKISYDDGESWQVLGLVFAGPSEYSCLAVLPDGQPGILFEGWNSGTIYQYINFGTLTVPSS